VNCFQKLLSSWHDTTSKIETDGLFLLWIAFKNYYLRDTTQQITFEEMIIQCCELLSKIIIFVTRHNYSAKCFTCWIVVNCFQKLLSSWHDTTYLANFEPGFMLWIAFKNYYLRDTTQPILGIQLPKKCCELLSKIIIFVTRHNHLVKQEMNKHVVNCFQKLLSSWHDTTSLNTCAIWALLWIAFKNYYLRDTTQRRVIKMEI